MASSMQMDRNWSVRQDVLTLAEARRIEGDKKRLRAAQSEARKMLTEQQAKLGDLEEVAEGTRKDNEKDE